LCWLETTPAPMYGFSSWAWTEVAPSATAEVMSASAIFFMFVIFQQK
jgi:hypothetical protein